MRPLVRSALLLSIFANMVLPASAETTPVNAIKYRKFAMSAMAAHVGALSLAAFGRVEHEAHLATHAQALANLTDEMKVLFPANSVEGDTKALALIWAERAEFDKSVTAASTAAAALNAAVAANDKAAIAKGFKAVGESCKGCHDRYREED